MEGDSHAWQHQAVHLAHVQQGDEFPELDDRSRQQLLGELDRQYR
jgi:hypothetical protein